MTAHNSLNNYVRFIFSGKNFLFFLLAASLLCILQLIQLFIADLSFNRTAISNHEFWRLLSGGLVHANFPHVLLNIIGLFCLLILYERQIKVSAWCIISLSLVFCVNSTLYLFLPSTEFYFGFSGALHGLFIWHSITEWRENRSWFPVIVILLLISKLSTDVLLTDSFSHQIIGMRVHWQAHWIGAISGALFTLISKRKAA